MSTVQKTPHKKPGSDLIPRIATENGKDRVYYSDGSLEIRFTKFKKGVYTTGTVKTSEVIKRDREYLRGLGITDSEMNVITAISENEGNLDSINTWDNAFLSFGMFQWTMGAGNNEKGELPALIKKIKDLNSSTFETFFGIYGLDTTETTDTYGLFTLDGLTLRSIQQKEQLRLDMWAYYFSRSAHDPVIQGIQIQHALSRINTFHWSNSYAVKNHFIGDLITSEYGIGLLLDNHVNRPGYVRGCLEMAFDQCKNKNPDTWGTEEESAFINAYLNVRITYGQSPMTDAEKRALTMKKYLENGTLSNKRDSFKTTSHAVTPSR